MTVKKYLESIPSFKNKRIAITGATSGIGEQLFYDLANKGASIILLARNLTKANELKNKYPDNEIDIIEYDQTSYKKIEDACDELVSKYQEIYVGKHRHPVLSLDSFLKFHHNE